MRINLGWGAALVIAASALGGCGHADRRICSTVIPINAKSTWPEKVDTCLHRWGYRLAPSPGDARMIAEADIGACSMAVEMSAGEVHGAAFREAMERRETVFEASKDAEDAEAAQRKYLLQQALFRVVQARAGHCAAP